tara:strand:- start:4325 stop:4948 length:624 start_codon:yes stop_codon:yes gene_type:complete
MSFEDNVIEVPFLTAEECEEISTWAFDFEQELIDKGYGDNKPALEYFDNVTTSNYQNYNFFHYFPNLADRLVDCFCNVNEHLDWPIICQAWVNIYRKGQGINWHNHQGRMGKSFSCNIFVSGDTKPGVTYKPFNSKGIVRENKVGYMHIFPCELFHYVAPLETDTPRVTLGLTVHSNSDINTNLLNQLAFNSQMNQDTIILTKEHHA